MASTLGAAWHAVVKRAVADWLILSAAAITIVLATSLLAAGPIYAEAVTLGSLHRTLRDIPVDEANILISLRTRPSEYAEGNRLVTEEIVRTFETTGGSLFRRVTSDSYQLPGDAGAVIDLTVFRYLDQVQDHVTVIDGTWPVSGTAPHQTAVSTATAAALGLRVGDELRLTNRRRESAPTGVTIAGIYQIDDPTDAFWYDDELDLGGVEEAASFRTLGPLLVDLDTMLGEVAGVAPEIDWRVFPDYDQLSGAAIRELRGRVQGIEARLNDAAAATFDGFRVETRLAEILSDTERSLLVARSGVLLLSAQLAVLAGYALLLTAGLLADGRTIETSLMRSRGASTGQVVTMAVLEGAILTVPAILIAPWLAVLALHAFSGAGPLASIGLSIRPSVSPGSYALAALAGLGCIAALAVPAGRSARSFSSSYVGRGRQSTRSTTQRAGVDIALLVLAGLAFWQLRFHGSQITSTVEGRIGIDPLLVLAPALGLLAGGVLALRTIPLLARGAERIAAAGASAVPALSAWQVARRPLRYARSALLLIIALSIGIFATAYTTTWTRSQDDQAAFQTGADIRAAPSRAAGSLPSVILVEAHRNVPGVGVVMALDRQVSRLSRTSGNGLFVMLEAERAGEVVRIRDDLAPTAFPELMAQLVAGRPTMSSVPLAGEPSRIALDLAATVSPLPDDLDIPLTVPLERLELTVSVSVVLQDGRGLLHEVPLGVIPTDGSNVRLVADLRRAMPGGGETTAAYPVSIVDIVVTSLTPAVERTATIDVAGVGVLSRGRWEALPLAGSWQATTTRPPGALEAPAVTLDQSSAPARLKLEFASGAVRGPLPLPAHVSLRPAGTVLPEEFPIVVSERFLASTDRAVGQDASLSALNLLRGRARIVGTVEEFPTVDPRLGAAILIDLPTVQMLGYEAGRDIRRPTELWMTAGDADTGAISRTLEADPLSSTLLGDRIDRAKTLKTDPVALGTIGALSLGFVAAAVFAAVGFSVSSVVSARERVGEFALLRALGLSSRQLGGWLSVDHGVLVIASLALGTLVGLVLAWAILPLVTITQEATTTLPAVAVVYPWRTILLLELGVLVVLGGVVTVLAALVRRLGLASLLRLGND